MNVDTGEILEIRTAKEAAEAMKAGFVPVPEDLQPVAEKALETVPRKVARLPLHKNRTTRRKEVQRRVRVPLDDDSPLARFAAAERKKKRKAQKVARKRQRNKNK